MQGDSTTSSAIVGELTPAPVDTSLELTTSSLDASIASITHDFTDCCISQNVTSKCMGFCTIHNILDGTTGIEPEMCEKDFPQIVKCMADGRNHVPCCEKQQIPDICQVSENDDKKKKGFRFFFLFFSVDYV
jgi:hypothetical protein